jgi:hypothetical protein
MFLFHPAEDVEAGSAGEVPQPVTGPEAGSEPVSGTSTSWSNRTVALLVVGLMGAMAVIGLTFAEMTTPIRREHDMAKPRDVGFAIPLAARLARVIYVTALALFLLGTALQKERPRALVVRIGAGLVVALLALIILDDALALLGKPSPFIPPRWRREAEVARESQPTVVPGVAPAQLAGLRYLPPDTNVILGVHVAEAIREPMGQELLSRFRLGSTSLGISKLEKWTGLRLEDLDQVVVGVRLAEVLPPRLTLVVKTRQPFNPAQLRATMKADRKVERRRRDLYRFPLEKLDGVLLEGVLWCPDNRTVIIGLTPADLDEVPIYPVSGLDLLPAAMSQLLNDRLRIGSQLWFIGNEEDWSKPVAKMALMMVPPPEREMLKQVRTLGIWLRLGDSMSLNAAVRCADADAAEHLDKYLAEKGATAAAVLGIFGDPEQARPVVDELARTMVRQREGDWVDVQARVNPETVRERPKQ